MADNDHASSSEDAETIPTKFSLQLITHVPSITKTGKRSKSQLKKVVTTKEMSFICLETNYVSFLEAILSKCGLRYNVSVSRSFRFKYYYPGRKRV